MDRVLSALQRDHTTRWLADGPLVEELQKTGQLHQGTSGDGYSFGWEVAQVAGGAVELYVCQVDQELVGLLPNGETWKVSPIPRDEEAPDVFHGHQRRTWRG